MEGERLLPTLKVLILPAIVAILTAIFWYYARIPLHLDVGAADADSWRDLSNGVITFHSLLAAAAVPLVIMGHMETRRCKKRNDRAGFIEKLMERIPLLMKVLLAIFSFVVITVVLQEHFVTVRVGMSKVACLTFVLGVYWQTISKLDDPVNTLWSEWVDAEWLKKKDSSSPVPAE